MREELKEAGGGRVDGGDDDPLGRAGCKLPQKEADELAHDGIQAWCFFGGGWSGVRWTVRSASQGRRGKTGVQQQTRGDFAPTTQSRRKDASSHTRGRFVEEEDGRVGQQLRGDVEALPLAAREACDHVEVPATNLVVSQARQVHLPHRLLHPLLALRMRFEARHAVDSVEHQVLADGQPGEEKLLLVHVAWRW